MNEGNSFQILFFKSGAIYVFLLLLFVILLVDSISSIDGIANPQLLQREYYYFYPELFDELPESIQESVDENIDASLEHDQNHWLPVTEEEFGLMGDSDMETPYLMEELYLVQDDVRDMKTKLEIIGNETGGLQDEYGKCRSPSLVDGFDDPCTSLPPDGVGATLENCNDINLWCESVVGDDGVSICQGKYGEETDPDEWCNEEYEKAGGIVRSACPNICEYVKDGSRVKGTGENIEVFQRVNNYIGNSIDDAIQTAIDGEAEVSGVQYEVDQAINDADTGVDARVEEALGLANIAGRVDTTISNTLNLQGTCVEVNSEDPWLSDLINNLNDDDTIGDDTPLDYLRKEMGDSLLIGAANLRKFFVVSEEDESDTQSITVIPSLCALMSGAENEDNCNEHPGCTMPEEFVMSNLGGQMVQMPNDRNICVSNGLPSPPGDPDDECTIAYYRRGGNIIQNCPFTCKYNSSDEGTEPLQGEFGIDDDDGYRLP